MTTRRAPDGPNRRGLNAQKSAFNGALGGALRSARPTDRRSAGDINSTARNTLGLGGSIFRVADGYSDVSDTDYLMDRSGMLWYKDTKGKWVHQYEGKNNGRVLYNPDVMGIGDDSDIIIGYGNTYWGPTQPSGAIFVGQNNALPFQRDGSGGNYEKTALGNSNTVNDVWDDVYRGERWSDVFFVGSDNHLTADAHRGGSTSSIHGSSNYGDADRLNLDLFGGGNNLQSSGLVTAYIYGQGNQVDADDDVSITLYGLSNHYTIDGFTAHAASGMFVVGASNDITNSANSLIVGMGNTVEDAYNSWILGQNVTLTGDYKGILVANSVKIMRDPTPGGSEETTLILVSDDGTPADLTVSDAGALKVNGTPVSGGLDATGITATWVPTADGSDSWDWAAPSGGGGGAPAGGTSSQALTKASDTDYDTQWSDVMLVVTHGSDDTVARPTGASAVYWIGTVEPTNAIDNDLWIGGP